MPGNRSASKKPAVTWRDKLLTAPGIAIGVAFTGTVSWLISQLLVDVRTKVDARNPLDITVRDNPAQISAFNDQIIYGVIPADVRTSGSPGPGCTGFRDWLKLNRGVDAGATKLQIVAQNTFSKPIQLAEMRVKILDRLPPVSGIAVACPPAAEASFRPIEIDLDTVPPRVRYQHGEKDFGFKIQNGEIETFNVTATTARGHYRWIIELDAVVDGKLRTIEFGSPSGPFETTAKPATGAWSGDYQDGWEASPSTPRAGIPERISVGTSLRPLD